MKNSIFLMTALVISSCVYSQVGINTEAPKSSLDVVGKNTDPNVADGIIAPRVTGNELRAKNNAYGTNQNAAIVYVTSADTSPAGKTINVTSAGYYYYDAPNSVWVSLKGAAATAVTASNGLNATAGNVKLGGVLSDATTTITTNGNTNALAFNGLGTVAATNQLLALDASNRLKTLDISSQFDNLGIPRAAVFQLVTSNTYLAGLGAGGSVSIPMQEVVNKTGATGVTFTSGTNSILFRPGLYQITFVYESTGTDNSGCSLSSYFVDFPSTVMTSNRIHSTAAHNTGGTQNHGGAITYTARITTNRTWQIHLGRGVSGNCSTAGTSLKALSTQVSILKLE